MIIGVVPINNIAVTLRYGVMNKKKLAEINKKLVPIINTKDMIIKILTCTVYFISW